jgi:radical SAM superfamily enzyme YgiQ (UPF0313 family)
MIRTCLINPPLFKEIKEFYPPLGLAYIAAYLKREGVESDIIDANASRINNSDLSNMVSGHYDLVGISALTISMPVVIELVSMIKKISPAIRIIVGGMHPTVAYAGILERIKEIDAVVIGEGEVTCLEIIKAFNENDKLFEDPESLKKIDGIAFYDRERKKVVKTRDRTLISDLDSIPFPLFEKLPMKEYYPCATRSRGTRKGRTAFMITARGCPFKCTFCASQTMWSKFRFRSAGNIIREVEYLREKYGIEQIDFYDDTLTAIPDRMEQMCDYMIDSGMKVKWNAFARVTDLKDINLMKKMRLAGCYELQLGIESADQDILNAANKKITVEDTINAVALCDKAGIHSLGYFILGLPGETRETINRTINFARTVGLDLAAFYILLPYPGTPIYKDLLVNGAINEAHTDEHAEHYSVFKDPVLSACDLSIEELRYFRAYAIRRFYFSVNFIVRTIKNIVRDPGNIFTFIQLFREFYYLLGEILFRRGEKNENKLS